MRLRQLGDDGPIISVLGFGAWAAGGPWQHGWGAQDDDDSVAAIRAAVDAGVTWVDTAPAYGWGHSETIVGRALAGRDDVLVFTKCGIVPPASGSLDDPAVRTLAPDSIRAECEASLRRLGRDHIDLYQFHWPHPDDTVAVEDSWAVMCELVDAGTVRWIGVSNFDVGLLERCEAVRHVQSCQPPFSLVRRGAADDVLPWCATHGTGTIVYSPMQAGLLSGAFDTARRDALAPDDWRRRNEWFGDPQFTRVLQLVDALRPIAAEADCSVAELALAWVLAEPGVTGAIVGARSPAQVTGPDGWIGAGTVVCSPALAADLRTLAEEILRGPDGP